MAQIMNSKENRLTVADILTTHINDYQNQYPLWSEHRKIVYDLINCRTPYLGGHIDRCNRCGMMRIPGQEVGDRSDRCNETEMLAQRLGFGS